VGGSGEIRNSRDLLVWQKSMALAKQVYTLTRAFPGNEKFGLTAQLMIASLRANLAARLPAGQQQPGARQSPLGTKH